MMIGGAELFRTFCPAPPSHTMLRMFKFVAEKLVMLILVILAHFASSSQLSYGLHANSQTD